MKATLWFLLWLFPFLAKTCDATTRHIVYWNTLMTPELSQSDYVINVEIGKFMDILCPHSTLEKMGGPGYVRKFDLYNVTKQEHQQCRAGDREKVIFSCDCPEQEKKLTIKFQVISPSPLGFRFRYCQDYYFLALPRDGVKPGCHKDTTRLRISVACKEMSTTSATSKQIVTSKPDQSHGQIDRYLALLDRLNLDRNWISGQKKHENYETILIPKLKQVHNRLENDPRNEPSRSQRLEEIPKSKTFPSSGVKDYGNKKLIFFTCFFYFFSLLFIF